MRELNEKELDQVAGGVAGRDWGQAVKDANLTNAYPGGTNRGGYVSGQATDTQTPGYAYEIHTLAGVPG